MALDEKKYMKIFQAEAVEHLSSLSDGLLKLEDDPSGADKELIHELLRNAHTLKGSARMLGLMHVGDIAHKMEDLFEAIEMDEMKPEPSVIDALLLGTDSIKEIIDCASQEKEHSVDVNAVVASIDRIVEGGGAPVEPEPADEIEAAQEEEAAPKKPRKKKKAGKKAAPKAKAAKVKPDPRKIEPEGKPEDLTLDESREQEDLIPDVETPAQVSAETAKELQTIRVEAHKLDDLLDMAGELMISKIKLEGRLLTVKELIEKADIINKFDPSASNGDGWSEATGELKAMIQDFYNEYDEDIIELDLFAQEIINHTLGLRVLPASVLFDKYRRMVRDIARELGKEIRLEITGGETELDKQIIEELNPVLMHLVRNACDHGVEMPEERKRAGKPTAGKISINAFHKGHNVVIEITDDGSGIDPQEMRRIAVEKGILNQQAADSISDEEARYLIFKQGFTSSKIITDLSGRGVGMDVVRTNMERIKGDIVVESDPGNYTKVSLTAPLTLSIMNALLIMCAGDVLCIPLTFVEETVRLDITQVKKEAGREVFNIRGVIVPLFRLADLLDFKGGRSVQAQKFLPVVVVRFRNQRLGLVVDRYLRDQEIVVKSLGNHLKDVDFVAGATILRKGEPALILNVFDIFQAAEMTSATGIVEAFEEAKKSKKPPRILVVDDSITTRIMEKGVLEAVGYEVELAVSAEEGIEKLEAASYDLVVSDIQMPGMDGFEFTEWIGADDRFKELPVVIVTSLASDEDKRRGIEVGARAYIVKGTFEHNQLLNSVKSLVGPGREEE